MNLLYCFANASLTKRVLSYLAKKLGSHTDTVTVVFLNDRWIIHLKLKPSIATDHFQDVRAVFNEHGIPYALAPWIEEVLAALEAGCDLMDVTTYYHVAILSYGVPQPEEVEDFQGQLVRGLGYRPPSLV